jgi:cellulose synthase/poly-beta-1,6-N-acetylglucosamine synthase-like glycosyltransferase
MPEGSDVVALGSGNLSPQDEGSFRKALSILFSSWLGSLGSLQAKPLLELREVGHLPTCNVVYAREKALGIGGFSAAFADVCEDLEFSLRAGKAGLRLVYVPGREVLHHHREGWGNWCRKMFRYGRGQIQLARLYPRHLWGVKGLPLLAGVLALALFLYSPAWFLGLGAAWALLLLAHSFALCLSAGEPRLFPQVFRGFLLTQASYLAGEFWGVFCLGRQKSGKVQQGKG